MQVLIPPVALSIAGSDSGAGAGVQADLKTFAAHGVFGTCAITAVTAQNTQRVTEIHDVPAGTVAAQMRAILSDMEVRAAKTGMLSNTGIVRAVAEVLRESGPQNLIVDPVMIAKSGDALLRPDACAALCDELVPLCRLVTPNVPEAEEMAGHPIRNRSGMEAAARAILEMGPDAVLVKGGHLKGPDVADLLLERGAEPLWFDSPRIDSPHTHGTGCTLSAAITARLALGESLPGAVAAARAWLLEALRHPVKPGRGIGHPDHLHAFHPN